jgi:hypothetical protein
LVPAIVIEVDGVPRLGVDEGGEVGAGHDIGLAGFAVLAGGAGGEAREEPHAGEGDASAEAGGGFGDKTSAARAEDAEDLAQHRLFAWDDEEEAGDDDGVDRVGGIRKGLGVAMGESAVAESAAGGAGAGALDEAAREVDPGGVDVGVVLGETTGVEAGAATEFEDTGSGAGALAGEQGAGDLLGVVAEQVLAAEGVEPGTSFEEAVGWISRRVRREAGGHFAVAWIHALNLALTRWGLSCGDVWPECIDGSRYRWSGGAILMFST